MHLIRSEVAQTDKELENVQFELKKKNLKLLPLRRTGEIPLEHRSMSVFLCITNIIKRLSFIIVWR